MYTFTEKTGFCSTTKPYKDVLTMFSSLKKPGDYVFTSSREEAILLLLVIDGEKSSDTGIEYSDLIQFANNITDMSLVMKYLRITRQESGFSLDAEMEGYIYKFEEMEDNQNGPSGEYGTKLYHLSPNRQTTE